MERPDEMVYTCVEKEASAKLPPLSDDGVHTEDSKMSERYVSEQVRQAGR